MAKAYSPKPFGSYKPFLNNPPSDTLQVDVYSTSNLYLESITTMPSGSYSLVDGKLAVDIESILRSAQFLAGDFNVTVKPLRYYLGSADGNKIQIQDISADRLEVRVVPAISGSSPGFLDFFEKGFFNLNKQEVLADLSLCLSPLDTTPVFDYIQDKITVDSSPYSIIFRFSSPVPNNLVIGDLVWFSQQVSTPIQDRVKIIPSETGQNLRRIKGPNYEAYSKTNNNVTTEYRTWENLLATNANTKLDVTRTLFSGSLVEGIPLNIDYRQFENFVHFGSAYEQIKNFEYKVKLIEYYDNVIASLSTSLNGLANSSSTGSVYFVSQSTSYNQKKQALIGAFSSFEKFMYFESSSYESSSFGEFLSTAWPKINTTIPYILYSSTASQVENWMTGLLDSASLFDTINPNQIVKLIPAHVREDDANQNAELFAQMLGQYFDTSYLYIKHLTKIYNRDENLTEGFAKDLIYNVAENFGIEFNNGNNLEELWSYTLGVDTSGSYNNNQKSSAEDRTKEIWKRIINNLPFLLKTKGTERGVRALMNCFGIPQTVLRIKEYGGPEPTFESTSTYEHDRFYYSLNVGQKLATPTSSLYAPWSSSVGALELRFKPTSTTAQTLAQGLFSITNYPLDYINRVANSGGTLEGNLCLAESLKKFVNTTSSVFQIDIAASGSNLITFKIDSTIGYQSMSLQTDLYDGTYTTLAVNYNRSETTDDYTMYAVKTNYQKVTSVSSSSLSVSVANSSSYYWNSNYINLWIPGSQSVVTTPFNGSIQELRYWRVPLLTATIEKHALSPTSYVGNAYGTISGTTASYDDLLYRVCLGSDNNKTNLNTTSSLYGQQPNQQYFKNKATTFVGYTTSTSDYWNPLIETVVTDWADFGSNRSVNNKIRIEDVTTTENTLYLNRSIQTSAQDTAPIDSPKLTIDISVANEVNKDISEQFGALSIDDYIGDPKDIYKNSYGNLQTLQNLYFKKWSSRNLVQTYIRLLENFDTSLGNVIRKFVPGRTNMSVDLVVENHILERAKVQLISQPTQEELQYDGELDATGVYDMFGATDNIVGEIEEKFITLAGDYNGNSNPAQSYTGNIVKPYLETDGESFDEIADSIDLGVSSYGRDVRVEGSQYIFNSWYWQYPVGMELSMLVKSQSLGDALTRMSSQGFTIEGYSCLSSSLDPYYNDTTPTFVYRNSVGDDYSNAIQPNISGSRTAQNLITTYYTGSVLTTTEFRVPAEVQDYQIGRSAPLGILNQKYNGSKLTSLKYNTNSPDTYDKGPVITIIETSPNVLTARQGKNNNLTNT